jgi:hypothetical protein
VKELEEQVKELRLHSATLSLLPNENQDVPVKQEGEVLPEELDPLAQHGSNQNYYNWSVATRVTSQGSNQAYGASSAFYFAGQLSSYLDTASRSLSAHQSGCSPIIPSAASLKLQNSFAGVDITTSDSPNVTEDLPKREEERLFRIYWDHYHLLYPILARESFENHYRSLWDSSQDSRDPSALVDVLLAFCLQHDAAEKATSFESYDSSLLRPTSSLAGRWFFRRSQYFLQDEIEEPTINTFQSYAFSVLWLSQASWQNAAHNVLAATLRVGVVLGLHLEPPPHLPSFTRSFRRRLWWTIYSMDVQYAMEYGRPIAVNFGQVTCTPPKDDVLLEVSGNSNFIPLTFNTQIINLILATRAVYILLYRECARVLRQSGGKVISQDAKGFEACAKWLETKMDYLQAWLKQVPEGLKISRRSQGQSCSTDRSSLDLSSCDMYTPFRLLLELLYHLSAMTLYQHFISFTRETAVSFPVTERHAIACANHAITIINIIHQDLNELGHLRTWHKLCSDQLSAALSLIGYIIAYPHGPTTTAAREAVGVAIKSFDLLAGTFLRAIRDSTMLRDVMKQVDMLQADGRSDLPLELQYPILSSSHTHQEFQETVYNEDEMPIWTDLPFSVPEPEPFVGIIGSENWFNNLFDLVQTSQNEDVFLAPTTT